MLDFKRYQEKRQYYIGAIDRKIDQILQQGAVDPNSRKVVDATRYVIMGGSDRLRPLLVFAVAEYFGLRAENFLNFAVATEFLHTNYIIYDDLPGIDDTDTRYGRPSVHRRYGVGIALLAAQYCLFEAVNLAFDEAYISKKHLAAARQLAKAVGFEGMIGGQCIDLTQTLPPYESGFRVTQDSREEYFKTLMLMIQKKTVSLLTSSMLIPATMADAKMEDFVTLTRLGQRLGIVEYVKDDIVDADADRYASYSSEYSKLTIIRLFGRKNAMIYFNSMSKQVRDTCKELDNTDGKADFLFALIEDVLSTKDLES